jgi:hypothetical protein
MMQLQLQQRWHYGLEQIGCSTPPPQEGSHGTRADAASSPSAVTARGRRPAAPGQALATGAAPALRGAAPARTFADASQTRTLQPHLASVAPTRRGAAVHLLASRGPTTRTAASADRQSPVGPAGAGLPGRGGPCRPDPVRRTARRQPGPARPGRPARGPFSTYSVTLTLHSPPATPVLPHYPRLRAPLSGGPHTAPAQQRSGTPPVAQQGPETA